MSIEFSEHALEQMKERGIGRVRVLNTVNKPDIKKKSFKNRVLRQKQFGGKILEVATITEGPRITVVTAYYPEEELNKQSLILVRRTRNEN